MNRIRTLAVTGIATLALTGCFTSNPQQSMGTLFGAGAGALAGGMATGNAGGAIVGAMAGGMLGNIAGASLDAANRRPAAEAEYRALEYGRVGAPVEWRGTGGYHGDVVAGAPYRVNDFNCRDYTHTIYVDGQPKVGRGTACKQGDGTWRLIS